MILRVALGMVMLMMLAPAPALAEQGYELYYDGKRVGHEPTWDAYQVISNLKWNQRSYPETGVTATYNGKPIRLPEWVSVKPVVYVPRGEHADTRLLMATLSRHLDLARERWRVLLKGRGTFEIERPVVHDACNTLDHVLADYQTGSLKLVTELMERFEVDRFSNPYIFLIVIVNPRGDVPPGGGRPMNGGVGMGGGIVLVSSTGVMSAPSFQSTLQHELGHAFGLLHVDEAFGWDMGASESIMSYNLAHHWKGFAPPEREGVLMPEELRILAEAPLVLPGYYFDPSADVPEGYVMDDCRAMLGVMGQLPTPGVDARGCWGGAR